MDKKKMSVLFGILTVSISLLLSITVVFDVFCPDLEKEKYRVEQYLNEKYPDTVFAVTVSRGSRLSLDGKSFWKSSEVIRTASDPNSITFSIVPEHIFGSEQRTYSDTYLEEVYFRYKSENQTLGG